MNRMALTDRMEVCARLAQTNAEAASKLAEQAVEVANQPAGGPLDDRTTKVHNLDVAAGMHNAAAAMLIQCVGTYAAMRGEVGALQPSAKDRELSTPAEPVPAAVSDGN